MAKQFIISNGKFVAARVDGQKKFVIIPAQAPAPPTDLEVKETTVEFNSVMNVMGYNFYLNDTSEAGLGNTYLGQMITHPVPMTKIYPGTALYPNN